MTSAPVFWLTVRSGPEPGKRYRLEGETAYLGRHRSNDIVLACEDVSRHHARLIFTGTGYAVEDLGSSNGTYVNDERVSGLRPLADGDLLRLGSSAVLAYTVMAETPQTLAAAEQPTVPVEQQRPSRHTAATTAPVLAAEEAETQRRSFLKGCMARAWAIVGTIATCAGLIAFLFVEGPQALDNLRNNLLHLPQPPPCQPARADEVLILVADFEQEGVKADARIYRSLAERVASSALPGVRVQRVEGIRPRTNAEAVELGERCNATLVIWGFADSLGIEPQYEVVRNQEIVYAPRSVGMIAADDVPTFRAYVAEAVPNQFEYLMLLTLGQIAYFRGEYERAITALNEALAIDLGAQAQALEVYLAYYYRGSSHLTLEHYEEALADLDRAIEMNPSHSLSYYARGYAHIGFGEYALAVQDFSAAIERDPSQPMFYLDRGWSYSQMGENRAALDDWNKALELDPNYALAYNNRAYITAQMNGDLVQALADVNRALELDSQNGNFYDTRGYVYYKMGNYEAALMDFNKALDMGEDFAYYGLGLVYEARGERARAIDAYTRFLALYPFSPQSEDARQHLVALGG